MHVSSKSKSFLGMFLTLSLKTHCVTFYCLPHSVYSSPCYIYLPPHYVFAHSQFLRLLALVYRSTPKNVKLQQFSPSVPQQPNGHDCCLYALEFAHVLRSEPETTLHLLESGSFPTFSVCCIVASLILTSTVSGYANYAPGYPSKANTQCPTGIIVCLACN